jgi:cytochrome oxidase assembly protein ShyY1
MNSVQPRNTRVRYEGEPTLAQVMRTPKWIGGLLLAMLVAGVFAWLGQWQLGFAISLETEDEVAAEVVRPLSEVTGPGESVTDASAGYVFTTSGTFVAGDFQIVEERNNGGTTGVWVVGHLAVDDERAGHLAVAIGWAPDMHTAEQALAQIESDLADTSFALEGRYMPGDAAVRPVAESENPERILSMAPAQLVNLWQAFDGPAYPGFIVLHPGGPLDASALSEIGLHAIDSVAPLPVETVNWLNLFYALEWVVFAGFAVFFWYRLARDDWEKIHELRQLNEREQLPEPTK